LLVTCCMAYMLLVICYMVVMLVVDAICSITVVLISRALPK